MSEYRRFSRGQCIENCTSHYIAGGGLKVSATAMDASQAAIMFVFPFHQGGPPTTDPMAQATAEPAPTARPAWVSP